MRYLTPLVALTGCYFISDTDEQRRLGLLDTSGDGPDDAGLQVVSVSPDFASACEEPTFDVTATVDGAYAGATFGVAYRLDEDAAWSLTGEATAEPAVQGRAGLSFSFTPALPACADGVCDHALAFAVSGPAEGTASAPNSLEVTTEDGPALASTAVVSNAGETAWGSVTLSTNPLDSLSVSENTDIHFTVHDDWLDAGGDADALTYTAAMCPSTVDPAIDASTCVFSAADANLVAPTAPFGTAACADRGTLWSLYLRVEGHPCDPVWLPAGEPDVRFVTRDCDGDGLQPGTDCDDLDAAVGTTTWYADADQDGFGDVTTTTAACAQPGGYVGNADDCRDDAPAIFPGAVETCDGNDTNCSDGEADSTDPATFYADADGDGYGDATKTSKACTAPSGFVADGTDCDDTETAVHPGAPETCDDVDTNCAAGETDATDQVDWYLDADGDGHGSPTGPIVSCDVPGRLLLGDDCDDGAPSRHPGATELCDGLNVDEDCDDVVDYTDCGCNDAQLSTVQGETDIDCGGDVCHRCSVDDTCIDGDDCGTASCFANTCQPWSLAGDGNGTDTVIDLGVAGNGEPITLVSTNSSPLRYGTTTLTGIGAYDQVVSRTAADGSLLWARRIGNGNDDMPGAIDVASNGDSVVAGGVSGSGNVGGFPMSGQQWRNTFAMKLNGAGTVQWAVGQGTDKVDSFFGVAWLGTDVVAVGQYNADHLLGIPFTGDVVVRRLSGANGATMWTRQFVGNRMNAGVDVAALPSGDVVVVGYFGNVSLDAGTFNVGCANWTSSSANPDGFVAKLSGTDGTCVWATPFTGAGDQFVSSVVALSNGDVVVAGTTRGAGSFGTTFVGTTGQLDAYVARLDGTTGAEKWATGLGGGGNDTVDSVAIDGRGFINVAGRYENTADFGTGPLPYVYQNEPYLARIDPSNGAVRNVGTFPEWGAHNKVVVGARGDFVYAAADSNSYVDFGDTRRVDPGGQYGVHLASVGPAPWRSTLPSSDGQTAARAGTSCKQIHTMYPPAPNGAFYIDTTGGSTSDAWRVYCDQTTGGGGWTRVASIQQSSVVCSLSSALRTEADVVTGTQDAWLSSARASEIPFTDEQVMLYGSNTLWQVFTSPAANWSWANVANGTFNGDNASQNGVTQSEQGGTPQGLFNSGGQTLLGGRETTSSDNAMAIGCGAMCNATTGFTQDANCGPSGFYSMYGTAWGQRGFVYIR